MKKKAGTIANKKEYYLKKILILYRLSHSFIMENNISGFLISDYYKINYPE